MIQRAVISNDKERGMTRFVLACVLGGLVLWTSQASAGWVLDQQMKGAASGRQRLMVQSNRMKTVTLDGAGAPTAAFVVDLDAQTITHVDYANRRYTRATAQEYAQAMRSMQAQASGQMAEAMRQMKDQLDTLPPEQRRMVEEMMRKQGGGGAAPGAECRPPTVELRPTAQRETIAGYAATKYDMLVDGKLQSEMWMARDLAIWRELDRAKMEKLSRELASASCSGGRAGVDLSWSRTGDGYPVRIVHRADGAGVTTEVVSAESRTVAASEFQPPAGFARKTLAEMMGGPGR
jgi:hypothetical protein